MARARTDRHNNPTAFTTAIAKQGGLRVGVDYVEGDSFDGGRFFTARLLGDPIGLTIRVIDKISFATAKGAPRWSYMEPKFATAIWRLLNRSQKTQVIGFMYRNEGGSEMKRLFE